MKVNASRIYFFIIFLIPFSGFISVPGSGELGMEMYTYPLLAFILYYFFSYKWRVQKTVDVILLLSLLLAVIFSLLANYDNVVIHYFKNKSGFEKGFLQIMMFMLFFMFYLFLSDYIKKIGILNLVELTYKYNLYAFGVVFVWSIFEVLNWYTSININSILNEALRADRYVSGIMYRLRSSSYEPPALAMYLIFSLNFFIYKALSSKSNFVYACIFLHFLLIFLSDSRTGLIISVIQISLLLWFLFRLKSYKWKFLLFISLPVMVLVLSQLINVDFIENKISSIYNWDEEGGYHTASNVARLASQYAALSVFEDNIFVGAGIGQFGFLASSNYPEWSISNYLIIMWSSENNDVWPPGFSFFTRLLSETGVIGFLLFVLLVSIPFFLIKYKNKQYKEYNNVVFLSKLGLISAILVLMQFDSIRYVGFWIYLAMSYSLINIDKSIKKYENRKDELV